MRVSRVFVDQPLEPGGEARLDDRAGHYLTRVLKLRSGDRVVLFNGDGFDYAGELRLSGRGQAGVVIDARLPAAGESPLRVTLAQAISRGERMDLTLQKATELGVAAIQPLLTERVEVRLAGSRLEKRMMHWRGVLRSACEQSGRALIPALAEPLDLTGWLRGEGEGPRLVLDPGADSPLSSLTISGREVAIVVGPEGGFSEEEFASMRRFGVLPFRLGPRTLRTETAGPAALAVLQTLAGDF